MIPGSVPPPVRDPETLCRDELVAAAVGMKSRDGITYNTVAKNVTGLMPAGSDGVNHGMLFSRFYRHRALTVMVSGIAVDGIVTLLTVTIQ